MASIAELKLKRNTVLTDIKSFLNKPSLSADESRRYNILKDQYEQIGREISLINFSSRIVNNKNPWGMSDSEVRDVKRYSFTKFLRESAENKLTGIEAEMNEQGKSDLPGFMRAMRGNVIPLRVLQFMTVNTRVSTGQNSAVDAEGGVLAGMMPVRYLDALSNALILPGMGANYLTGLNGTVPIVTGGLFAAGFAEEGNAIDDTKMTLANVLMKPKRVAANATFSKQLLKQGSIDIENWIKKELIKANALAILSAALNGSGQDGIPKGILNTSGIGSVVGGDNGLAPTFVNIIDLETIIANENGDVGSLGYVTNSKVRSILKRTLKNTGASDYVYEKGLNGYYTGITNACPSNLTKGNSSEVCSAILLGNWSDLFIGDWGTLDIVVDPYTRALNSEVEVTVNSFADIAIGHPKSFAAMKDALTA